MYLLRRSFVSRVHNINNHHKIYYASGAPQNPKHIKVRAIRVGFGDGTHAPEFIVVGKCVDIFCEYTHPYKFARLFNTRVLFICACSKYRKNPWILFYIRADAVKKTRYIKNIFFCWVFPDVLLKCKLIFNWHFTLMVWPNLIVHIYFNPHVCAS